MRVSPGFANLFNNFEAPSGTKVPLIHEMYQVIYHTLCLGGSGGIWLTSLLVIFGKPSCGVFTYISSRIKNLDFVREDVYHVKVMNRYTFRLVFTVTFWGQFDFLTKNTH